jgi:hypothetical protein
MNQQEDFAAMAKAIIDSTFYMVLGTADESGQPWVSPVYFTASKYKEFYWISSPQTKHSRNCQSSPVNTPPIRGNTAPVIRGNDAPPTERMLIGKVLVWGVMLKNSFSSFAPPLISFCGHESGSLGPE